MKLTKKIQSVILAAALTISVFSIVSAAQEPEFIWPSFRGNSDNNTVITAKTPTVADEAALYFATRLSEDYTAGAISPQIIVGDDLVFCMATTLYKMNRFTGELSKTTGQMAAASSYSTIPPLYADGKIFVSLAGGTVQAFDAKTFESLWVYIDELKGQPNAPLTYFNGYVYTGFYTGDESDAAFVCLKADKTDGTSQAAWRITKAGGFYWAGAYVCESFLLVGTADGKAAASQTGELLSLNPLTGEVIDKIDGLNGDVRSTVAHDTQTDRYYFTTNAGSFYSVAVNENGTFKTEGSNKLKELKITIDVNGTQTPSYSTSTPVIYNGRAYIGVAGTSGFGQYTGHGIMVIDLDNMQIAYTAKTKGYPQASGVLTTAYESTDGYVYVYFIENYTPGTVRVIKDKKGQTEVLNAVSESYVKDGETITVNGCAPALFTPAGKQANYAICSPIVDEYGTLYFKNDSGFIMALGSKIENLSVTKAPLKTSYAKGESFDKTGMEVSALLKNGLKIDVTPYVTVSKDALTSADTDVTITYSYAMYGDQFGKNGNTVNVTVAPAETYTDIFVAAKGDVNLDGKTDISDAMLVFKHISGKATITDSTALITADIDNNNSISLTDAIKLFKFVAGKTEAI